MVQFSKGTFYCRSESGNSFYLMCEGVQSAGQFCNNFINTRSTFEALCFGRLTGTLVFRSQRITFPANVTRLHDEIINLLLVSPCQNRNTNICRPIPTCSFPRHSLLNSISSAKSISSASQFYRVL